MGNFYTKKDDTNARLALVIKALEYRIKVLETGDEMKKKPKKVKKHKLPNALASEIVNKKFSLRHNVECPGENIQKSSNSNSLFDDLKRAIDLRRKALNGDNLIYK
jgi:hypothetical protein